MAFLIPIAVFFAIFLPIRGFLRGRNVPRHRARALILGSAPFSTETRDAYGQPWETRDLSLDVEIPGQDSYDTFITARIPNYCEAWPGTTLEVSVDARNRDDVVITGPIGFHDWIDCAPWLVRPTVSGPLTRRAQAMIAAAVAGFFAFIVFCGVLNS
jgi:hypothetical protein